jgi:hypothetical protein
MPERAAECGLKTPLSALGEVPARSLGARIEGDARRKTSQPAIVGFQSSAALVSMVRSEVVRISSRRAILVDPCSYRLAQGLLARHSQPPPRYS